MLYQIMRHCRNFFPEDSKSGMYKVEDGTITLDFVKDGQHFLVEGSTFNDGVYQYPAYELTDETFRGDITALAIPKAFLDLVAEIEDWANHYTADTSPYTSESFGGYSYSRKTSAHGGGYTWRDEFKSKLDQWRKR